MEGYVEILEDLLLAFRVPVFARRARRAVVARPKLYLFDAGVFRSLRPSGPLDRPEERAGPALEGLVAQHLRPWAAHRTAMPGGHEASLFYWRAPSGTEVDFVVYGPAVFHAIEVKNTARPHPWDTRSLNPRAAPVAVAGRDPRLTGVPGTIPTCAPPLAMDLRRIEGRSGWGYACREGEG